tara:strand:+ start:384 stop:1232 length:849 start_codon:yes stop_codon:yes gene_type:complete
MFFIQLFKWLRGLAFSKGEWWVGCPFILCGGSDPQPPPPPPAPTIEETTAQTIQAQVAATPDILAAQQEFGPQFTQLELEQLQRFGPEFTQTLLDLQEQFGPQVTAALRKEQQALAPELTAAQDVLTEFLGQEDLLTDKETQQFQQDIRQAQNVRGFGIASGVGAEKELEDLTRLRQDLKTRRLNLALSTAGRVPISAGSQVQQQQFGPGQLIQNVSPGQAFGLASSTFGTQGSIFGAQAQFAAQSAQPGIGGQIVGGLAGSLLGGFGGGIGTAIGSGFGKG